MTDKPIIKLKPMENLNEKIINEKEQECEELKKTIQFKNEMQMEVCGEKNGEIEKLKAENEELERLYKELQDDMLACNKCRTTIKLQQQLNQLKAENKKLKQTSCNFKNYCTYDTEKLEQTLIEIKEIAEKEVNTRMLFADKESNQEIDFGFDEIRNTCYEVIGNIYENPELLEG